MDDARLRRIGFVTSRYGALRAGVSRAVAVPMIAVVGALQMLLEYTDPPKVIGLTLGLANIFGFAALTVVAWVGVDVGWTGASAGFSQTIHC